MKAFPACGLCGCRYKYRALFHYPHHRNHKAPVALAALIKNGPLWQELRASLLKTITRKENVFISWVMRLLIVVSLAWTGWAITLVLYLLTVIAFWITRNQMAQQVAA